MIKGIPMDLLKELLQIQHELTLHKISTTIFPNDEFEQSAYVTKYNKRNYCLATVRNSSMKYNLDRVQVNDLISTLTRDHNPSSSG